MADRREYFRIYHKSNPEREKVWRENAMVNALVRKGYTVLHPAENADGGNADE